MSQAVGIEEESRFSTARAAAQGTRVLDARARTASKAGISPQEAMRLDEAFIVMRKAARKQRHQLWYIVISAPRMTEYELRRYVREVKSRITDELRRAGIKLKLFIEVLESEISVHSNIVLGGPEAVIRALERSPKFAALGDDQGTFIKVKHVYNSKTLNSYLKYEATSQTHYRDRHAYPRRSGSHPLGEGGGDRVRPSEDMWRVLEAEGIERPKRTYASRNIRHKAIVPEPVLGPITWATDIRGQGLLFDTPPIAANLNEHYGGLLDRSKATDLESWRRLHGLTQRELAARAGIAQPTYANAVARRDCLSRDAAARLHAVMSEAA